MTSTARDDVVTLTLDALMSMTSVVNGQDVVQLASRHAFLCHVKRQPSVRDVFFETSSRQPLVDNWSPELAAVLHDDVTAFDFSRYSVLYVAEAICKLRDKFLIYTMLEENIVSEQLKAMYDSSDWKKIGRWNDAYTVSKMSLVCLAVTFTYVHRTVTEKVLIKSNYALFCHLI